MHLATHPTSKRRLRATTQPIVLLVAGLMGLGLFACAEEEVVEKKPLRPGLANPPKLPPLEASDFEPYVFLPADSPRERLWLESSRVMQL